MSHKQGSLSQIHIASPCTADWNSMSGDDRNRYCAECNKNVYNISELTRRQAESLIRKSEGDLCLLFYRRTDGTILTSDCPVGFAALRRRVTKVAGAIVSAVLSCASPMFAQAPAPVQLADAQTATGSLIVVAQDTLNQVLQSAEVTLAGAKGENPQQRKTDSLGRLEFAGLKPGVYSLKVFSPGFKSYMQENLIVRANEQTSVGAQLMIGSRGGTALSSYTPPSKRRFWRKN
jgi:hypothetical protein